MILKNTEIKRYEIKKRTSIMFFIILILFFILIVNYFSIQLINSKDNKNRALLNTLKIINVESERGNIYDRNDNLIADNKVNFSISIVPEKINNYGGNREQRKLIIIETLNKISENTDIKINEPLIVNRIMSRPSFEKTKIFNSSNYNEVGLILNRINFISGVELDTNLIRNYNYKDLFFHSLGYAGIPSKEDLSKGNKITRNTIIGKTGLEKYYNEHLLGSLGKKEIKIGATGRVIERKLIEKPKKGLDLKTTLDLEIQKLIHSEFVNKKGVAIVIDVNSGDIISFYSAPSVDANLFSKGMSTAKYNKILNNLNNPMLNRLTSTTYSPASTIKPFIAVGALMGDFIDPYENIFSAATYRVGNQTYREWQNWGHGDVDMARSLSRSSNYYYYDLGYNMGIDYIHEVLSGFGFGESPNIKDFGNIRSGINPSNKWKIKNYGERFYKGEEVMIAIGGGQISTSAIELVYGIKLIANGGKKYQLKFNYDSEPELISDLGLKKNWVDPVRKGLFDTVNTNDGTGRAIRRFTDIPVAGKTGTAQVVSSRDYEEDYDPENIPKKFRNHSLFMGYAPYESPEIAVVVIGENEGGGSGFAAELTGKIVQAYLGELSDK